MEAILSESFTLIPLVTERSNDNAWSHFPISRSVRKVIIASPQFYGRGHQNTKKMNLPNTINH